jgi:thioester reductase-like protein
VVSQLLARDEDAEVGVLADSARTNIVPVDFVVDALVELMHANGRDGQTFHLTAPKTIGLRGIYRRSHRSGRAATAARVTAGCDRDAVPPCDRARQGSAQHGRHRARHSR